MATTDSRPVPRKNVAFRVYFPILDKTGAPVTGAAGLDSERSIDGAAFADCTNEATEIGTSGIYYLDLTAGEMNGDAVVVRVQTTTTDAKTTVLVFYPEEAGDYRADVVQIAGAAVATGSAQIGVNLVNIAGAAVSTSTAQLGVNAVQAGGTAWGSGAITAGSIATGAITNAKFAAGAIDAAAVAPDAIGASELAADAVTEIANGVWALDATGQQTQGSFGQAIGDPTTQTSILARLPNATPGASGGLFIAGTNAATTVTTSFTTTFTGNLTGSVGSVTGLTASNLDATVSSRATPATVWSEALPGSYTSGQAGYKLNAASTAGDPWSTALPGSYTSGQAGYILGNGVTSSIVKGNADSGTTTTMVDAARTEADTDYWKNSYLVFTSGTINGQTRRITAFNPATDTFTFTPATTQAVSTQTYEIWPGGQVDAGAASDPWSTAVPGAYGAGTAGARLGRIPDIAAGSANGLFIAGSNAATTVNFTGNLSGSVGSVTGLTASNLDATISSRLAPTVAGRTLDVTATGEAGIDWANIGGATSAQTLSGTTVGTVSTVTGLTPGNLDATVSSRATQTSVNTVDDFLDTEIADIQARLPAALVGGRMDASLSAAGLAADAVDEILDEVVEGTTTMRQALRLFLSALASKVSGAGTGTITFRDFGDTKPRITADVDANGNRTSITVDVS